MGTTTKTAIKTIVIAWTAEDCRPVGPMARIDLGERTKLEWFPVGRSAMWKNQGTDADVEKARAYAATQDGYRVFVYPATEPTPLARARRDVLKDA